MLCADMVQVTWTDHAGKTYHATALLEDISPSGACLQVEAAIPLGAAVQWESPKRKFSGNVRYCVYREIGYFVGVEFQSACKWSRQTYRPRHLLDLQRLAALGKNR